MASTTSWQNHSSNNPNSYHYGNQHQNEGRTCLRARFQVFEITIYQGWAQAAFQTDKFGGVAAIVNDFSGSLGESYTATYPGGGSKLKVFPCLDAALAGVAEQYKEEAEARSELAPPDAD